MSKKIYFIVSALFVPFVALAQAGGGGGNITITGLIHAAENTALLIASGITVILWIVAGILFLIANGDPGKLGKAKTALFGAVAGTLIIIVAGSAISLVGQAFGIN